MVHALQIASFHILKSYEELKAIVSLHVKLITITTLRIKLARQLVIIPLFNGIAVMI